MTPLPVNLVSESPKRTLWKRTPAWSGVRTFAKLMATRTAPGQSRKNRSSSDAKYRDILHRMPDRKSSGAPPLCAPIKTFGGYRQRLHLGAAKRAGKNRHYPREEGPRIDCGQRTKSYSQRRLRHHPV